MNADLCKSILLKSIGHQNNQEELLSVLHSCMFQIFTNASVGKGKGNI